ncbi:MAG TPA: menaquinol-cytochrome c reductase cytochrome b subunit [Actinomycetota bacterium]|nr:menaquinol-cytochrome c reductase cytochrome b subunit [Actinomycetota bacterium]
MPTPDEVFEQVLKEETDKGSSPAVAQARAKAARVRAQRGSATPNKPDSSTAPAPKRDTADAPAADAPKEEAPAAEAPAPAAEAKPAAAATATKPAAAKPAARAGTGAPAKKAVGNGGVAVPDRVQRLLAVVKPEAIQKVERQPMDRVNVWPHLMVAEFASLMIVLAMITFFSVAVDAPLRELANFSQTPNPSKAPWYFLGLQELLRYFHPQPAGVTLPTVIIIGLFATPFIDRNPSTRPDDRKLAIVIFTFFVISFAILTTIGMFFRGPGFNFVFPWETGPIFFEL